MQWKSTSCPRKKNTHESFKVQDHVVFFHIQGIVMAEWEPNPADLVSRGVDATVLRYLSVWWNGPIWLQQVETSSPMCKEISDITEQKTVNPTPVVCLLTQPSQEEVFTKLLSWNNLRVTA
jgi:hypothetical protein